MLKVPGNGAADPAGGGVPTFGNRDRTGVAGIPDPYRGETVKAWIVPKPGETVTEEELKAFCKERLAAYKVPTHYEFRGELPKTTVGKILRRELVRQHKEATV